MTYNTITKNVKFTSFKGTFSNASIKEIDVNEFKEGDRINIILCLDDNGEKLKYFEFIFNDIVSKYSFVVSKGHKPNCVVVSKGYNPICEVVCLDDDKKLYLNTIMALEKDDYCYYNTSLNVWIQIDETKRSKDPIKQFIHLSNSSDNDFKKLQRIYLDKCHIDIIKEQYNINLQFDDDERVYYDCQKNKFYGYKCGNINCKDDTYPKLTNRCCIISHSKCSEYDIREFVNDINNERGFILTPLDYFSDFNENLIYKEGNEIVRKKNINKLNNYIKIEVKEEIDEMKKNREIINLEIFKYHFKNIIENTANINNKDIIIKHANGKDIESFYYDLYVNKYNEKYNEIYDLIYNKYINKKEEINDPYEIKISSHHIEVFNFFIIIELMVLVFNDVVNNEKIE